MTDFDTDTTDEDLESSSPPEALFVRMTSGEDLIADVIWNDDGSVVFINPMKILYVLGDTPGSLKLSLVQWVFPRICEEQAFIINSNDIVTMAPLSFELMEYYFDTVEQTAKGKGVIIESYKNRDENNDDLDEEAEAATDLIEKYQEKKKILH